MDHVGGIVDHHGLLVAEMQMPQRRLRGTRYSYWRTTEWRQHEKASFFAAVAGDTGCTAVSCARSSCRPFI